MRRHGSEVGWRLLDPTYRAMISGASYFDGPAPRPKKWK